LVGLVSRISIPLGAAVAIGLALGLPGLAQAQPAKTDAALSDLLKAQTQAFSEAGQVGDAAAFERYLDPDVVFMNETGAIATKKELVDSATPQPKAADRSIKVTEWALRRQGDTATATFVDVLTQSFHGQTLVYRFRSTETWAKRPDGWKMIASQTMTVPRDPPAVTLAAADLDAYAGVYQVDPEYKVIITRDGEGLTASANGAAPIALKAELRDVLFVPGAPNGRRIFQRDAQGRVTGYISRRDGTDIVLKKVA
jgi:ketosteroid isomerase-like protein